MDEPQEETYTLTIEQLLDIFLDGMYSGTTSTLLNVKYGKEEYADLAREEAYVQMLRLVHDPAGTETIRDTIRNRIEHPGEMKRTMLRLKGFGD